MQKGCLTVPAFSPARAPSVGQCPTGLRKNSPNKQILLLSETMADAPSEQERFLTEVRAGARIPFPSPRVVAAFLAVPRHDFVPRYCASSGRTRTFCSPRRASNKCARIATRARRRNRSPEFCRTPKPRGCGRWWPWRPCPHRRTEPTGSATVPSALAAASPPNPAPTTTTCFLLKGSVKPNDGRFETVRQFSQLHADERCDRPIPGESRTSGQNPSVPKF